jgi:glyceraldehyde 3-phosphate dehydrogenase
VATRVGINGFGRIGRQVLKAITDRYGGQLEVVAINDLVPVETNAHLLKYDSNYGRWERDVRAEGDSLVVDGRTVKVFSERDPGAIPWGSVGAEIVVESTGLFTDATKAAGHRRDSVKKVIISAPAKNEDVTVVLGVNADDYDPAKHHVISNASCTTNGLAPVVNRPPEGPDDDHPQLHQLAADPRQGCGKRPS